MKTTSKKEESTFSFWWSIIKDLKWCQIPTLLTLLLLYGIWEIGFVHWKRIFIAVGSIIAIAIGSLFAFR
jgi:hypothetical protein